MREPAITENDPAPESGSASDEGVVGRGAVEHEPDYRFTLANERTFLAWIRSALSLLAAGIAVVQLVPAFKLPGVRTATGGLLVVLAVLCAGTGVLRWQRVEHAMRRDGALPPQRAPWVLAVGLIILALLGLALMIVTGFTTTVESTTDRRGALTGAGYVIITFEVGGVNAFRDDVEIPRRYGLDQTVGDPLGPGGVFRFLRSVVAYREIAADLAEVAPAAQMINYANPDGDGHLVLNALGARTVGMCHSDTDFHHLRHGETYHFQPAASATCRGGMAARHGGPCRGRPCSW